MKLVEVYIDYVNVFHLDDRHLLAILVEGGPGMMNQSPISRSNAKKRGQR